MRHPLWNWGWVEWVKSACSPSHCTAKKAYQLLCPQTMWFLHTLRNVYIHTSPDQLIPAVGSNVILNMRVGHHTKCQSWGFTPDFPRNRVWTFRLCLLGDDDGIRGSSVIGLFVNTSISFFATDVFSIGLACSICVVALVFYGLYDG